MERMLRTARDEEFLEWRREKIYQGCLHFVEDVLENWQGEGGSIQRLDWSGWQDRWGLSERVGRSCTLTSHRSGIDMFPAKEERLLRE